MRGARQRQVAGASRVFAHCIAGPHRRSASPVRIDMGPTCGPGRGPEAWRQRAAGGMGPMDRKCRGPDAAQGDGAGLLLAPAPWSISRRWRPRRGPSISHGHSRCRVAATASGW